MQWHSVGEFLAMGGYALYVWGSVGACAVLALAGVVNVPIIYFSVQWWNTLHQGASVGLTKSPSMAATMLLGMLLMALAFWMYSIAVAMVRVRCLIKEDHE